MSKDIPEVGDVWKSKHQELRIYVLMVLDQKTFIIFRKVGSIAIDKKVLIDNYTYLGKSKANIDDLFKTENEE